MYVGIFSVLVRQYASYGHVLVYIGILFRFSTLVRLVRPCSMHVCILFGLSTLVRLVRPCSHACWYFIQSQYVSTLSTALFSCILKFYSFLVRQYAQYGRVLCMLVFYSILVRQYAQYGRVLCISVFCSVLVRQYAQYGHVLMHVGILFSLSTLVRLVRPCSRVY